MRQQSSSIRVLHVEDEPDFAELASTFLERENERFDVETATRASEGLDRLMAENFHCVVSDYDMPGQDGIEFLEAVREERPDLPFILYTGKGSEEVASDAISAGATDYLQKGGGTDQYELLANRVENAVDQYRATQRAAELDRIRTLASDINQALVRAESRDEIEKRVCETISESHPYLFAWIGDVDTDPVRIEPRTAVGTEEGYLDEITSSEGILPDEGPGGMAIRERRVVVLQDIAEDPEFEPWLDEALDRGYQAVAVVPLEYEETLYGALAVYAGRPHAFDDDEQAMLAELGDDIAHGIHSLDVRDRLRTERDRRRALFENAPGPVIASERREDGDTIVITDMNDAFEEVFGYDPKEIVGKDPADLIVPEDGMDRHQEFRERATAGETITTEVERITADGPRTFILHIIPYSESDEGVVGMYAWYTDISERQAREQTIEGLQSASISLMEATTDEEVAEITTDATHDILGLQANGVHFYDETVDGLVPAAWTTETEELVGEPPTFAPGEGLAGTAFETGDPQIYDDISTVSDRYNPDTVVRSQIIFPLGDHGVLVIGSPDADAFDEVDVSLAETLAEHATTAIDRIEREQQLQLTSQLVQVMNDGAVVVQDGEIRYTNPRVSDLVGYSDEELVGTPMGEFIASENRETVRQRYQARIAGDDDEHPGMYEIEVISSDGNRIPVEINVARIEYDGEPATLSLVRDITERKEHERKRNQIIERVTDAIVEVDADWQFTLVNEQAEQLYEMDEENLLGRSFWEVFTEAEGTRFEMEYRNVMETRAPTSFTEYYPGLDGWFDIDVYPNDDGGVAFYFREVTDRIERSHELERRSKRFQYVEEVADIGYWEIDAQSPEPHDVSLSDGVYDVHDLSPDEPFDVEKGLQFYHPEDRPTIEQAVDRTISEGEPYDLELRLITASGKERWVHSVGEPVVRDGEVVKVRGVIQGITDRKQKEQELARQNERLDEFASLVSHDLRNPLNVARGRLELAQDKCDTDLLDDVAQAHERMDTLIEDLLTLAQTGNRVDEREAVDLGGTIESCWTTIETADSTLVSETDQTIWADPSRLKQLLENLFRNAVEHGGDDVSVTVGDLDDRDGFYISDDGPGIPDDERREVFEAGYSTTKDGTGFGLNIVQEIAKAQGWEITISDSETGGARFEITDVETAAE